jgi:hypothetical protein
MSTDPERTDAERTERPTLRIVAGNPSPEEIAAVTVVLTAVAQAQNDTGRAQPAVGGWADPSHRLRRPLPTGPGAWQAASRG